MSSSADFSRVSIPGNLRRTIEDIKEIAGKHSDEDIYAVLKECNMDPNETAQKLLYLDTFHEVKNKRDRRKVTVDRRAHDEYRRASDMQQRRTRGDAGVGRKLNARRENGNINPAGRASESFMPVLHKTKDHSAPAISSSTAPAPADSLSISSNGRSYSHDRGTNKNTRAGDNNNLRKLPSLPTVQVKQLSTSDPGPTPTSTPTNTSSEATGATIEGGNLKTNSSNFGNSLGSPSVSGLYSSATDPVLVPSLNPRNHGSVGIIKREKGNQRNTADISGLSVAQAVSGSVDLTSNAQPTEFQGVERSHLAESSRLPSSTNHHIAAANGNEETYSAQPVNEPSKGDPSSEKRKSEVENKLQTSAQKSVIFPNHLHVPEAYKNALTFGSLDTPLEQNSEKLNPRDVSVPTDTNSTKEPSLTDYPDRAQSPSLAPVDLIPTQDKISSGVALRCEEPKQEMLQPVGSSQNSLLPVMPDYGLSFVPPPAVGSHVVHVEAHGSQGGNSLIPTTGSAPPVTQPTGIAQSSIAVSPQLFPYLRQPYPPNYIPYNPYFSQLCMPPQNAHQLLSHSGLPQQLETGNIYMSPTAVAASGVKFPMPPISPLYKPGNLAQYGISSGYGSYGASGLGYSSGVALPPGTSTSNDEIAGSELKEKKFYSMNKQNENLHAVTPAMGRDIPALQPNVLYNLPQGQPLAFSPAHISQNAFGGIYHPTQTQTMSAPSLVQSLQQSHAVGGITESIVPPLSSYLRPQLQPLPQQSPAPQQQQGQMNWNQKIMNRDNI